MTENYKLVKTSTEQLARLKHELTIPSEDDEVVRLRMLQMIDQKKAKYDKNQQKTLNSMCNTLSVRYDAEINDLKEDIIDLEIKVSKG